MSQAESADGGLVRTIWLGWLVFVVYGSLVPLDFHPQPLSVALDRLLHLQWLDVGLQGRADWVANGVLYLPLGLLSTLVLARGVRTAWPWAAAGTCLLGGLLAAAVEVTQVFFPPRTVSLNDLLAESLGCLSGAVLAGACVGRGATLSAWWRQGRQPLSQALLPAGVLTLLVLSLFPFDLLVSAQELEGKLRSPFWGWWRAPLFAADGWAMTLARLVAEALVVLPLGVWWSRVRQGGSGKATLGLVVQGLLLGSVLGLLLEVAQWLVASGVSQGMSVLSRALGWAAGAVLGAASAAWNQTQWRAWLRRLTLPVLLGCLVATLAKAGVSGPWHTLDEAMHRLRSGEVHFLPLYYHYFTSEGAAVQSVVPVLLLSAPLGVLCWAWHRSPGLGAGLAGLVAAAAETLRLWTVQARPDPSNVWIAAAAAFTSAWLLYRWVGDGMGAATQASSPAGAPPSAEERQWSVGGVSASPGPARLWAVELFVLAVFAGLAGLWWWRFPVFQPLVGLLLVTAASLVWWRPVLLMAVAVAGLPVLNLTIWSGREFLDEFDVLLLLCLAVAWVRRPPAVPSAERDRTLSWVLALVGLSLLVSTLAGWAPWEVSALQHPQSPISPWYTVRLFKGALLAALLGAVAHRQMAAGEPVAPSFGWGMVVGLAGVLVAVMWERMVFVGLLNFADEYRVAGPVLPMRLGGAYLDAFLVTSLPFALVGALHARHMAWRACCTATALGTAYAMAVTFTRSTYLAVAVVALVVSVGLLRPWPRAGRTRLWLGAGLMALLAVAAYPIITGPFATARMAVVSQDAQTRLAHARHVLDLGEGDAVTRVFGQGLGRFPARNYWVRQFEQGRSGGMAVHQFLVEDGVSQLRLGAGPVLFLDQAIDPPPAQTVQVLLRARAAGAGAKLVVSMCHKWLLSSGYCESHTFVLPGPDKGWQQSLATLNTGPLGGDTGWFRRPVRLTLYNAGHARVDVDAVSVRDLQRQELVRNGGFDAGSDHWSYTSDDHLAWHVKNMGLAIWFDLGWFGLLAFGALLVLALARSGRGAWRGDRSAQALLAALAGLLVVAVFDSVVDEPRFLLLLLLLTWLASRSTTARAGQAHEAR